MTTGGQSGTSGWTRVERQAWLMVVLVACVVVLVNATSNILEFARSGVSIGWWEPVLWEVTSAIVIVAMAPLVGHAVRRWTPRRDNLLQTVPIHFALTLPFALVHIAAIFVLRNAVYWLVGGDYGFFDDGVGVVLLYEWRKDVLVYAAVAATYWIFFYVADRRRESETAQAGDRRIEIRDGGTAVFLAPGDILFVEAAGNYVEFHTGARTHLVRGTLAAWEARLTQRGFVRAHRARLVNRARIVALKPTPAGDIEITLDDGRVVAGSRRFRGALDAPSTPTSRAP